MSIDLLLSVKCYRLRGTDVDSFNMNLSIIITITLIHIGGCCSAGSTSFDVLINILTPMNIIFNILGRFSLRQWPKRSQPNVGVPRKETRQLGGVPVRLLTLKLSILLFPPFLLSLILFFLSAPGSTVFFKTSFMNSMKNLKLQRRIGRPPTSGSLSWLPLA